MSDKFIFEHSGLCGKLEPFVDAVMADKGFRIDDALFQRGIALHRPPYLRKQKQLPKSDALHSADLARARVHVERVIGRLRQFSILNAKLPWRMVPYVSSLLNVICGLTNLCSPILAEDKFAIDA